MAFERHLILQDLTLHPSGEWTPPASGWTVARIAEGVGYWFQGGNACEFKAGDGFVTSGNASFVLRASQLGQLKLEFFSVQPQFLNGVLTVTEGHQLSQAANNSAARLIAFTAADPLGQKFARLVAKSQRESLPARSALLQLWAQAVAGTLAQPLEAAHDQKLQERFRQLVAQMPDTELATRSLTELAEQLHCSERHFSRLFRQEFGLPLRTRQTELRLLRARQLLADADAKIINVAYDSGYRHLGLFNAMFKKRFGVTPSEWRQQNLPAPAKNYFKRGATALVLLLAALQIFLAPAARAEGSNATPHFKVEKYLVAGNTVLPPNQIGGIMTNSPNAFGTNVTFADIRAALGDLQMAYRERGFVTVSVSLPPQKLTNATVKIKVTEGRLAAINVKGNNYYSTENVLRALPSLHTNMLFNSHVFQRELDTANANRNRQIYPVIGPGLEPGTSELTLKVKDTFPLHARVEINNQATPNTPDSRVNFNAQYDNLWQLEHQVGVSYSFTPVNYGTANTYYFSPVDLPLIANESAYYRLPLGRASSVQQQIDDSGGRFGYNEITHQFQMPPPSGRPDLTLYGSRATSDTGIQLGPPNIVGTNSPLLGLGHRTAGENVTLNEGLGFKLSLPLPQIKRVVSTLTLGADYKRYRAESANADLFYELINTTNNGSALKFGQLLQSIQQPVRATAVEYFPVNVGVRSSASDSYGTTFFNAQANFNVATIGKMSAVAYTTNAADNFVTVQLGASREQRLYKDWTMLLRADGQWASTPLFSNEQYAMGGGGGVRGYTDGENYGDTGWRVMLEPRTPLVNIGMVDGDIPFWVRASVFMDYGETYLLKNVSAASQDTAQFWGCGASLTCNIGSHLDARLTVAWPLLASALTPADTFHFYFGIGAQF
jgi:hemolysin activation/secretion protein